VFLQNLRELSMHLLKQSSMRSNKLRSRSLSEPNAMHVHAVATKYASSQLEISRSLCAHLTLAAGVDARLHKQIGFQLMYVIQLILVVDNRFRIMPKRNYLNLFYSYL